MNRNSAFDESEPFDGPPGARRWNAVFPWVALLLASGVAGCSVPAWPEALRVQPLVTHVGLGHLMHPIEDPGMVPPPSWCHGPPDPCYQEHVYIFGVNGLNPLCTGNFNGMLDYFRQHGFAHTYFGQLYTSHWFACEIRKIRHKDPEARIVLIGFSWGANYAEAIANNLNEDGTRVDLLVYLVGDLVWNTPASKPANVCRLLNIRAKGLILLGGDLLFNGADIDGARNCMLKCRHIVAPSSVETLTLLMEELQALAYPHAGPGAVAVPARQ
jgi:hypothetical protein